MTRRLEGKVAIVNGGGCSGPGWGNGKATAVQFAREGASVVVADINPAAAQETAGIITSEGGKAIVVAADVTSIADMNRLVASCLSSFGRLDILMQNVGIASKEGFRESEAGWDRMFAVNLKGAYFAIRAAIEPMLAQKSGRIITVSSIAGLRYLGKGQAFSYGVSKAAVAHMTKLFAVEFADQGIRCNCLALGMMDTPLVRGSGGERAERMAQQRHAGSPTGKQGTAWDTAHLAAFLASDEANYINGVELPIDGGLTAKAPDVYK